MVELLQGCFRWQPAALEPAKVEDIRMWLKRFKAGMTIFVPVLAFETPGYLLVKHSPPHDKAIALSHLVTFFAIISLFPWVFITFVVLFSHRCRARYILITMGLIDLGFTVAIAAGAHLQSHHLPATLRGCNPETWQVGGALESLFVLEHKLGYSVSPREACSDSVLVWHVVILLCICQFAMSYMEIFSDPRPHSLLNPRRLPYVLSKPIRFGCRIFIDKIAPSTRYGYNYITKLRRRICPLGAVELPEVMPYTPRTAVDIPRHKLVRVLNIEHILLGVADYLCFQDVINLSLASRALREAVYPARDLHYRVPKLRTHSCDEGYKHLCPYCNNTICLNCNVSKFWPGMPGEHHVTHCKPCCSTCYRKVYCQFRILRWRQCHCTYAKRPAFQSVCRACSEGDREHIQSRRHKRYQKELRELGSGKDGKNPQCLHCKEEIKAGVLFWICDSCNRECKDRMHPSYVLKGYTYDVERGEVQGRSTGAKYTSGEWR